MSVLIRSSLPLLNPVPCGNIAIVLDEGPLPLSFPLRTEWLTADGLRSFVKRAIDLVVLGTPCLSPNPSPPNRVWSPQN
jgi:hypothetical protein